MPGDGRMKHPIIRFLKHWLVIFSNCQLNITYWLLAIYKWFEAQIAYIKISFTFIKYEIWDETYIILDGTADRWI